MLSIMIGFDIENRGTETLNIAFGSDWKYLGTYLFVLMTIKFNIFCFNLYGCHRITDINITNVGNPSFGINVKTFKVYLKQMVALIV